MTIQQAAKREVARMQDILPAVKTTKKGKHLLGFANNYAQDSKYFLEKKKYIEAFEAAIIAWAYLDIGLKLKLLSVPKELKNNFTA